MYSTIEATTQIKENKTLIFKGCSNSCNFYLFGLEWADGIFIRLVQENHDDYKILDAIPVHDEAMWNIESNKELTEILQRL